MKQIIADYPYLLPAIAYLLGSVPFGLVFSKAKGIDPRLHGSGNIGATNISRVLGKGWGITTLLCDTLKGYLPVLAAIRLELPSIIVALTGLAAVAGHCYSVFLTFKGGKGVATALGVFLAICPKAVAIAAVVFAGALYYTGYVSVGSLASVALMPVLLFFFKNDSIIQTMAWTVCFIIWLRHKDNIARLRKGEEKKITSAK